MIVVDANIAVALIAPLDYSDSCAALMSNWAKSETSIAAPILWEYEIVSTLRKMVAARLMSAQQAREGLIKLDRLPIERILPELSLHEKALAWAEKTRQMAAYDAQYLALAEHLGAEMWTADKKLHNALRDTVPWLHHVIEA